jgi:hypothetical protein
MTQVTRIPLGTKIPGREQGIPSGGRPGAILQKKSSADFDFEFAESPAGLYAPRSPSVPDIHETVFDKMQTDNWSISAGNATKSINANVGRFSGGSYQFTTQGDNAICQLRSPDYSPVVDMTDRGLSAWIRVDGLENVQEISFYVTGDAFANFRIWTLISSGAGSNQFRDGEWIKITMPWGWNNNPGVALPSRNAINKIQLRIRDDGTGPFTVYVGRLGTVKQPASPKFLISADDTWSSQADAAEVADEMGIRMNLYIIPKLIGQPNYLTWPDVHDLAGRGHVFPMHSEFNMVDLLANSGEAAVRQEIEENKARMVTEGLYGAIDHFALPQGAHSPAVIDILKDYFTTIRTTANFGETSPPANRHLRRCRQVLNSTTQANFETWADNSASGGAVVEFLYHRFETPDDDSTEVQLSEFRDHMEHLRDSGYLQYNATVDELMHNPFA